MLHGFSNINISWFPPTTSALSLVFCFFLNIIFKVVLSRAFELQPVRNAYFSTRNSHEMLISDAQLQTVACHEILTAPFKLKAVSQIIEVHSYSCNCCNLCFPMHKQGKRPPVATTTCKCVFLLHADNQKGFRNNFPKRPEPRFIYLIHTTNSFNAIHKFFYCKFLCICVFVHLSLLSFVT